MEHVPQQGLAGGQVRINGDLDLGGTDGQGDLGVLDVDAQEEVVDVGFVGLQSLVHVAVRVSVADAVDDQLVAGGSNTVQVESVVHDGGHLGAGSGGAVDDLYVVEQALSSEGSLDLLGLGDVVGRPGARQLVGVTDGTQHHGGDFLLGNIGLGSELAAADTDHQTVVVGAVDPALSPETFFNVGEGGRLSLVVVDLRLLAEHKASDLGKLGAGQVIGGPISAAPTGVAFEDAQSSQTIDIDRILGRRLGVVIVRDLLIRRHSGGGDRKDHSQRQKND